MSRRKVSPEAQIIALFTGLSDEGKRMVMFGLNAIMSNESPKSSAPVAAKKSSAKREAQKSSGLPCAHILSDNNHCMEMEDNPIHNPTMGYAGYHEFEAPKVKKAAK